MFLCSGRYTYCEAHCEAHFDAQATREFKAKTLNLTVACKVTGASNSAINNIVRPEHRSPEYRSPVQGALHQEHGKG